jgi:DNA repair exonuclease SbcCD nuclease subunit
MSFTFLHTADWQLGRAFKAFDPRIAPLLEEARFDAIDRLAEAARQAGAADVLVAGDAFDAPGLPSPVLIKALERLKKHRDVRWHLLPGNHDHYRPSGLWQRLSAQGLPGNVALHLEPKAAEIAPGVVLLPAPLNARAETADPTLWMDAAATAQGALRIGLAHGSIKDFGSDGESAIRIDAGRARRAGLAYLALGDWHGKLRVDARTWYSGTPEPDRYPENEPGFALAVRIEGPSAEPRVEPVPVARYTWVREAAAVASFADVAAIEQRLAARGIDFDRLVLRLVLTGSLPLAAHRDLDTWRERMAARVASLEWLAGDVGVAAGAGDIAALAVSGEVARAATLLREIAADPADARAQVATGALARLAGLIAEAEREAS